jgi:hypothetical protein
MKSAAPTALGFFSGLVSQPFRAGLTFGGRPSGPRIRGHSQFHFSLKLSQASQLLGMTKGGRRFHFQLLLD